MNQNNEREYWQRALKEVLDATGETAEQLAERMGVSVRQVENWKSGQRPSGIVAIRFWAYRKEILEVRIVMHGTGSMA